MLPRGSPTKTIIKKAAIMVIKALRYSCRFDTISA